MLTLTRKAGETVRIGDSIRITVKEVKGRRVRLMIDAPREVSVYREEIFQQIAQENERAAQAGTDLLGQLE